MARSQSRKTSEITTVTGGMIVREVHTGRLMEVVTESGSEKPSGRTSTAVKEASARRSAALKRLADR